MTERLNARIGPELARKLAYLRERTQKSTTEVVKASIEALFAEVAHERPPAELLAEFVGSAQGPRDLSLTYKQQLTQSLALKHKKKSRK